jgi:arabinan endo-1,5-alpha-L-arabinosidase
MMTVLHRSRPAAATVAFALVTAGCGSSTPRYENPVFEPVLADPSVVRADDGTFYAYGTEDDWGDGEGSRLVPIVRSADLVSWEHVGEALPTRPNWHAGFVWAPDVSRFGDKYLLYYAISTWGDRNPGIGVATADHPAGPFEDHGKLFDSDEIGVPNSIDPQLVVEADTPYLVWGSFHGLWGIELAEDARSLAGEKFPIADERFEAPYIIERDGAYWLFASLGSCCEGERSTYHVAVGRADALEGPYLDRDGADLLRGGGTVLIEGGEAFVGPGHNTVVQDDAGDDWLVYHAIDPEQPRLRGGATRRPMMLDRISWEDGWPAIAGNVPSSDRKPAPHIDP